MSHLREPAFDPGADMIYLRNPDPVPSTHSRTVLLRRPVPDAAASSSRRTPDMSRQSWARLGDNGAADRGHLCPLESSAWG